MVGIAVIAVLLGALLAQHFKTFVLLPACAAALLFSIVFESMLGNYPVHSIIVGALAAAGFQLGYILGLALHQFVAASKHAGLSKSGRSHAFPSDLPR
jgi:hypothetical protein